jgi:uncharacterized glyoxalase superfamily protein PhnB
MPEPYAPPGYVCVIPYLTVDGAQKLLDFLAAVFEAEVTEKTELPDGRIAHAAVRIRDAHIELADATERFGAMPCAVHIYVPDVDRTHQLALLHGGQSLHDPMEMEYSERASAVKDPLGNHWYLATYRHQ